MCRWFSALSIAAASALAWPAVAEVKLANVFSDHAVLQRGIPVPVWGTAEPGEKVTVQFAGQSRGAVAAPDGRWRVVLEPLKPGGPHELSVTGKNSVRREDILVGDVWICAGQSNMGTTMSGAQWWMAECPGAKVSDIRFLNMGGNGGYSAAQPRDDVPDVWYPCTPATSFSFSAIGYFFARQMQREQGVPIGMIKCSSWGAAAEPFVPLEALRQTELFRPAVERLDAAGVEYQKKQAASATAYDEALKAYEKRTAELEARLAQEDAGLREHWYDSATDVAQWGRLRLPGGWEQAELNGSSGAVWLRRNTSAVASWVGKDLRLQLGGCSESATVYFNGTEVGRSGPEADAVGYRVPAGLVRAGDNANTIVVRVVTLGGAPGSLGSMEFLMCLAPADGGNGDERMPLPGEWRYKPGCVWPTENAPRRPSPPASPAAAQSAPGSLYNGMLAPIAGYGIKGVLWYQGESNADRAKAYETLFPLVIDSWRKAWQQDFTFLWVQLPNFLGTGKPKTYVEPAVAAPPAEFPVGWAALREAQFKALAVPNTGMVVTIDIGETWSIHPNNKRTVADRLVLAALGTAYGKAIAFSGPLYDSMTVNGSTIQVRFRHTVGGLVAKGGALRQFAIAGEDRRFVWADAQIARGDSVVVSSGQVPKPVAVRYAFSGDPQGANLGNAAGLPASPFRTDDWDLPAAAAGK